MSIPRKTFEVSQQLADLSPETISALGQLYGGDPQFIDAVKDVRMSKQSISNSQITALDAGFEKIIERGMREGKSAVDLAKVLNEAVILTHNEGIDAALSYVAAAAEEWAGTAYRTS